VRNIIATMISSGNKGVQFPSNIVWRTIRHPNRLSPKPPNYSSSPSSQSSPSNSQTTWSTYHRFTIVTSRLLAFLDDVSFVDALSNSWIRHGWVSYKSSVCVCVGRMICVRDRRWAVTALLANFQQQPSTGTYSSLSAVAICDPYR